MSDSNSSAASGGISILGLLGILFVALKLCGVIDWSWWWVTAPFWGGIALFLAIGIVFGVVVGICAAVATIIANKAEDEFVDAFDDAFVRRAGRRK